MTEHEKLDNQEELRGYFKSTFSPFLIETMERAGFFTNCLNCDRWDKANSICGLAKELPPPEIIVLGCENHQQNIPF